MSCTRLPLCVKWSDHQTQAWCWFVKFPRHALIGGRILVLFVYVGIFDGTIFSRKGDGINYDRIPDMKDLEGLDSVAYCRAVGTATSYGSRATGDELNRQICWIPSNWVKFVCICSLLQIIYITMCGILIDQYSFHLAKIVYL